MNLNQVLESVPFQELLQTIQKKAKQGSKDVGAYIRAIFEGSLDGSDESEKRLFETFKCSLSLLQMSDLPQSTASEIVSLLLLRVDTFHTSNLMKLAEFFIQYAKDSTNFGNKWLEIFAKVLSCLSNRDTIVYQGDDMSGADLKKSILVSLFSSDVNRSCIVQLISVIKDIDLSEEEVKLIVENILKSLPDIDFIELPSFVYQLLLLSSKGERRQILLGILSYFQKEDHRFRSKAEEESEDIVGDESEVQYRQTEGTVILMASVSSRHDQSIGKEFSKLLKTIQHKPEIVFSPFPFAAALSLAKVQTNKDDIFESLKKTLTIAYQLKSKKRSSVWMREMIPTCPDLSELVKEAIRCSKFGWDHVCQGLVKFGFSAIETFGPRYVAGNAVRSVSEEGCRLGSQILRDTFKSHRIVRPEVLDHILNQIVTKSQKPVKHYIDILSQIIQSDPLFLLDTLPKIVEILDYIHFLPHKNAVSILQALAPLLRISMPLKDTLMLVLRKALFHRDVEARKIAVSGYLMILKKLNFIGKVSLSQSQTSVSSQASSASMISTQVRADVYVSAGNPSAKTMCLEVMGLLKRVLMQQGVVRQLLYEGLYDTTLQNKSLRDIVLELLLGQFEKYYDPDDNSDLPLRFSLCFQEHKGAVVIEEPLPHLITAIHLMLGETRVEDDEDDVSAEKMLEDFLEQLSKRLCEIDEADLFISNKELNDSPNDTTNSTVILNVYESLMEFSLSRINDFNKEKCEWLLKLFRKYMDIQESVISKKPKKTKSKTSASLMPMHVTLRFFSTIMHGLFVNGTFKHQEGLTVFRNHTALVTHMLKACNLKLQKMSENGIHDGFSETMINSFDLVLKIAKVYFKTYTEGLSFVYRSLDFEKLSLYFADGLAYLFTYISAFHSKNASKFIIRICSDNSVSTTQALKVVLKSVQKSIMKLLSDTENDVNLKECIPLLSVIKTLYQLFTEDFSEDVHKWLKQLCAQQVFQSATISRSFLSLCLTLGHQHSHIVTFLREIAFDLHYHLDDIDPEEKVQGSPKYNILTPEVSRSMVPNLISSMELLLDEVEYVLNYMKANVVVPQDFLTVSHGDNIRNMEQGVAVRLLDMISVFHEMVQTSIPPDNASTGILKVLARFYTILGTLSKYYLLRHSKSKSAELHSSFEKLVKMSHVKLTTFVYGFITYLQMMCEEGDKKKKAKSKVAALKTMREIKTVPALVFAIESYEKNLILLSKKFDRNLMNHMKLSTARDFRINPTVIASALQETNVTADDASEPNGTAVSEQDDTDTNEAGGGNDSSNHNNDLSRHGDPPLNEPDENNSQPKTTVRVKVASKERAHLNVTTGNRSRLNLTRSKNKSKANGQQIDNDETVNNVNDNDMEIDDQVVETSKNSSRLKAATRVKIASKERTCNATTDNSLNLTKNKSKSKPNAPQGGTDDSENDETVNNLNDNNEVEVEQVGRTPKKAGKKLSVKRKRLGVRGGNAKKTK